jgi:hypothetical protein
MAKTLTINQALDKILSEYKNMDMDKYPAIQALKISLIENKVHYGGNTFVDNVDTVECVIKFGTADPDHWK